MENNNKVKIYGTVVCLFILSLPFWLTPSTIKFKSDVLKEIIPVLSLLFVVALFMERAIEVFLSAWRSAEADEQDLKINNIKNNIEILESDLKRTNITVAETIQLKKDIDKQINKLSPLLDNRTKYRARSREIALWIGLGLGLLIAAVGVRTLNNFVDPAYLKELEAHRQSSIFTFVDVLLTGSLLSGGSGAINELMKIYTSFTQKTAEKAREAKPKG